MVNSPISFIRHMTKILLFMVVLKSVTVSTVIRKGNFILLDGEPDDLLYYAGSHHQWHLCNINYTVVDFYKYNRDGYISVDCYRQNYKKTDRLKDAMFLTGSNDKSLGPPMCPPLKSGERYDWRCEKDMSSAVTPYRNCTSVCKEGFYTVNNVTVRCSFMLDWIWFGDDTIPRCEGRSPSPKATPSNQNIPVHTTTSTPITDDSWILKNLMSFPLNSTSSRLTWMLSPLQTENPFPRTYRLSYRVKGATTYKEINLNGRSVNHTLTNLQKETDYDIKLCALGNEDRKKSCINMTIHFNTDKPVTQNSETNSEVDAGIIGGSITALICAVVFLSMLIYCCYKKKMSRGSYIAVSGRLSSSSSRSSQCSPGRYRCCLQGLNGDISLDDGPTKETLESTDTSNYEDKTENSNAKDTDKGKKLIDSGIKMCPIDSENDKEPLEDLSSVLSENKNSGKTEESQPVRGDSGSEMCQIDSENNKEQLEDLSSELSENKYSEKTEESEPVRGDSGGEMCPIDSQNNERQLEDISSVFSVNEISGKTKESQPVDSGGEMCLIDSQKYERQLEALSSEFSENEISEKTEKSQTQTVDCGGKMCPIDKEGDNLTLEYAPNLQDDLSILMDGSSGYASGIQIMSVELARHDNHGDTDNVGGSSGGNNMVGNAMEHRPDPSSIQEYDQLNQLLNNTQGVDHIVKPDSFDFNRVQDESYDQYHLIGQVAYEQENYCDQQFSRVQRSSSSSGITLPCPEHDGRSQRSTFTDSLQKQETFPTEDVVDANITNTHINKKECILDTDSEKCSNQWTPFSSMNSVTHIEEDIYRKHPVSKLPKHMCQEPCIDHGSHIYTYPASSEKEDKVQRSSRCQSLPLIIPQSNATNCNIQTSGMASMICTLSVEKAKEILSQEFFQILAYQLDPDSIYGNDKSWYGLTRQVLQWSEEKVKSIRHHTMGNIERGHFHETLVAYTAEHKFMSDIVKYFVQSSSLRPDVIQFIKRYHRDCPVCDTLYLQVNRGTSLSQSTQDIRKISTTHHKNNS